MSIQNVNVPDMNKAFLNAMEQNRRQAHLKPGTANHAQVDILTLGFSQLHNDLVQLSSQLAKQKPPVN
ncbi:hypothetical protein [Vampirovibrio sp.]|uniref:hypothetical protein n=1 Tax=Vampirovibrio sp. TaxID=2717857 RepID=UPI003593779A